MVFPVPDFVHVFVLGTEWTCAGMLLATVSVVSEVVSDAREGADTVVSCVCLAVSI